MEILSSPEYLKFSIFLGAIAFGVGIEIILRKLHYYVTKSHYKENHFSFSKYFFLLLFPLVTTMLFLNTEPNFALFKVFAVFSFLGLVLEWCIGFSYHKIVGQRLWTYHKYSLMGYTSWLTIPLWGMAGVMMYLLMQIFILT